MVCVNEKCKWNKGGCTLFPAQGWSACLRKVVGKVPRAKVEKTAEKARKAR